LKTLPTYPDRQLDEIYSRPLTGRQQKYRNGGQKVEYVEPAVVGDLVRRQGVRAARVGVKLVIVLPLL